MEKEKVKSKTKWSLVREFINFGKPAKQEEFRSYQRELLDIKNIFKNKKKLRAVNEESKKDSGITLQQICEIRNSLQNRETAYKRHRKLTKTLDPRVNSFKNLQKEELNRYKKKVWNKNLSQDFVYIKTH